MINAPDALVVGVGVVHGMRCLTIFVRVISQTRPAEAVHSLSHSVLKVKSVAVAHQ
jgi:hypothetical protein